ncbi:MAG: DNA polymerase I [Bacillota bacterium]
MTKLTDEKLLLVDGNSLLHRAFYALPPLTNRQGMVTNAAYGFTNMLLKALADYQPNYLVIAFDKGRTSFRHELFQAYKGTRKATPEDLRPQFGMVKRILRAMRIPVCELDGFEADDIIGTLSTQAEAKGWATLILTGDQDMLQLVAQDTKVILTRKGISDIVEMGLAEINKKFGLSPKQLIDIKALMGDSSDNIPGVPGVGEKTAVKLIQEYGTLEALIEKLDQVPSAKLRESLKQYREQALLSKELATINRQVELPLTLSQCPYQKPDYQELLQVFQELDFRTLIKTVLEEIRDSSQADIHSSLNLGFSKDDYSLSIEEIKCSIQAMKKEGFALSLFLSEANYLRACVTALGLAWGENNSSGLAIGEMAPGEQEHCWQVLRLILGEAESKVFIHDAKEAVVVLRRFGIEIKAQLFDTKLAAYLLNPSAPNYELSGVSLEHLDKPIIPGEKPAKMAAGNAEVVLSLARILPEKLERDGLTSLYYQVELPLINILADMEWVGVTLDPEQLEIMGKELGENLERLTGEIFSLAGEEFNINSPKQLSAILFEKLGLPAIKKTKTGYSTNAEVLEELAPHHQIVAKILEYRGLMKLKSSYVEGLQQLMHPVTGKVHTTFNQMVTATGRLSSTEPNLQNIPIRLELGRRLRKVFIPSAKDHILLATDYSQIELRVLAHISADPNLMDAFKLDQDIHTRTAAEVFGVPMDKVSPEMRRRAKAVNFGIVYGISDYGLARDLGITRKEAKDYIDNYLGRYQGVKRYLDKVVEKAKANGYVTTLLNRRRYLPDLFSSNFSVRRFGERTAMNTPIQGSAADIIKIAMVKVNRALKESGLKAKMILQVHDELIFDLPFVELEKTADLVKECMESAYSLIVPLKVERKAGFNWYDMNPI